MKSNLLLLLFLATIARAASADTYVLETNGTAQMLTKHSGQPCRYGRLTLQPGDTLIQKNGPSQLNLVCANSDGDGVMYIVAPDEIFGATAAERFRLLKEKAIGDYLRYCGGCSRKDAEKFISELAQARPDKQLGQQK